MREELLQILESSLDLYMHFRSRRIVRYLSRRQWCFIVRNVKIWKKRVSLIALDVVLLVFDEQLLEIFLQTIILQYLDFVATVLQGPWKIGTRPLRSVTFWKLGSCLSLVASSVFQPRTNSSTSKILVHVVDYAKKFFKGPLLVYIACSTCCHDQSKATGECWEWV